jgi:hypothetical protein
MKTSKYHCPKCGKSGYDTGEIRVSGGFWTKIFNIENRRFVSISCKNCGYTEFYNKARAKSAENVLDFFFN